MSAEDWDLAPCGLLRVDAQLRITAANATAVTMAGRRLTGSIGFGELLSPAGRLLFEAQFAPMLQLNGGVDEIRLALRRPDGERVPVLLNARRVDDTGTALVALMPVPERLRYEQHILQLYAREHDVAVALAQLTTPPDVAGLEIETRYLPGVADNDVGGDWYDAFTQPDGTLVVAIGDVAGHDIGAAASMAHLRGVLRTVGYSSPGPASHLLSTVDRTTAGLGVGALATAVVGRLVADADGCAFEWSNAGHPPPILLHADGTTEILERRNDLMLGVAPAVRRRDETVRLAAGDAVLLYTDGLIERRDRPIDDGIAGLAAGITGPAGRPLAEICAAALELRVVPGTDDVALLAVRRSPTQATPAVAS